MLKEALNIAYSYALGRYSDEQFKIIEKELLYVVGEENFNPEFNMLHMVCTYEEVQGMLSKLNEKESIRKKKGVYYTPADVVEFILINSIKSCYGTLRADNISDISLKNISTMEFAKKTTIFDPTCGAGEFLLAAFELKGKQCIESDQIIDNQIVKDIVSTIYGNDINIESIGIAKIRLLLSALQIFGAENCIGISQVMRNNFTCIDFVSSQPKMSCSFDVIVGNPPYVEDHKSGLVLSEKYGNIYANVLKHASKLLNRDGAFGFIIPLSYVSTPRMSKIRTELFSEIPEQFILNYADRPDCLFESVHQKLSIIIGKRTKEEINIYTGAYQYWYKNERADLFNKCEVVRNQLRTEDYIPKLGTETDVSIFCKIMKTDSFKSVYEVSRRGEESVYLNRREAFWMKAYRTFVDDPEYKVFSYKSAAEADYCYCLINSSLFWWFWISVSDCWHVSKELNGFRAPMEFDSKQVIKLAKNLRDKLEETKVYVGTKQTEYEYKHKSCLDEIFAIDDYINSLYGLSEEESAYIKNYALVYRTSGGGR